MARIEQIMTYNALKGIAAVGILFSHMSYLKEASNPFWRDIYSVFMSKGSVCCSLFMLFSGFFLNYTWKKQQFGQFVIRKLKRIYPLTILVFVAAIIVDLLLTGNTVVNEDLKVGSRLWFFSIIANLFLFKAFIPIESVFYSFHGPSWYISVLFVFYLIAYPVVNGIKSNDGDRKKKWQKITWGGLLTAYIIELIVCVLVRINHWDSLWLCYVNPWFRIFGEGFAGILLCEYMDVLQEKIRNVRYIEWIAVIMFIGAFLIMNLHLHIFSAWIQLIPMGLVIIVFRKEDGQVGKALKSKPFQFMGGVSFELYMTHAFVYEGLPVAVSAISKQYGTWIVNHAGTRFVITFILCIIVAWIVQKTINHILYNRNNVKS